MRRRDHALGFLLDCFSIGKGEFLPNPRNVIQLTPHVPSSSSWRSSRDSIQTKPRALTRCASCLQSPRLLETRLGRPVVPWLLAKRLFEELLKRKLAPLKAFSVSREFFISQSYQIRLRLRVGVGQSCSWSTSGAETSTNSKSKSKSKSIDLSRGKICCAFRVLTSIVADWRTWKLLGQPAAARSGFDSNRPRFQSLTGPFAER